MSLPASNWIECPISDMTINCNQRVPGETERFLYIDISSVDRNTKRIKSPQEMIGKVAPSRARKAICSGDVIVSMTRPNLNAVAMVDEQFDGQIASTGFEVLRSPGLDPRWLYYIVRTDNFVEQMSNLVQGALYPAVRPKDVQGYVAPLAPINEQTRIADKLDAVLARVDACRERLERIPAILKRFRQAVLQAACSGKLTAEWRNGQPLLPSWSEQPLGDLIIEGPKNGLYKPSTMYGHGIRILRIDNFYDGEVPSWEALKRLMVSEEESLAYGLAVGDIIVNRVNSMSFLGKSALVRELLEPCVFESNMMRLRLDRTRLLPEFCIHVLNSPSGIESLRKNAKQAVNQASINQTDVRSMLVPLPGLEEQTEIIRRVESLFACSRALESHHAAACTQVNHLASAILAKAFRGELVPQDLNDEPAEALLARLRADRVPQDTSPRRRERSVVTPTPDPAHRPSHPPVMRSHSAEETVFNSANVLERVDLESLDTDAFVAAFRQTLVAQRAWNTDEELLRALAQRFGYQRLGSRAKEALKGHFRAALLRRVAVREADGRLTLGPRTIDAYTRDELISFIPSLLRKGQSLEREALMRALLCHLGFLRLTDPAKNALKSALNGAIRRGVLESVGADQVRRLS